MTIDPEFARKLEIQQGLLMFQIKCLRCHSNASDGSGQQRGPNLWGVVGRVAGISGYKKYSPELARTGLIWTRKNLKKYMYDPQKLVPGTGMFYGAFLPAEIQGDCIVTYMESISPGYEERLKAHKERISDDSTTIEKLSRHPEVPIL
eukprot:145736_1